MANIEKRNIDTGEHRSYRYILLFDTQVDVILYKKTCITLSIKYSYSTSLPTKATVFMIRKYNNIPFLSVKKTVFTT